jgi:hypothetical protein
MTLLSLGALAQTYKWVDAQGQTHYTQVPPKDAPYETIDPATPPASSPNQDALNQSLSEALKGAPEQEKAAQAAAEKQAKREADCRAALDRITYLDARTPRRLATTNKETGEVTRMSDEEFQRLRAAEQEKAAKNCE